MKVNCNTCGIELNRRPSAYKRYGKAYCNASCQMKKEYDSGTRDRFKITLAANKTLREKTLKRFNEDRPNRKLGKRSYWLIYLPKYHRLV